MSFDINSMSSRELREQLIPLPTVADGYSRILLVGTTGAGKTTLLRHLIGSDHRRDRFPSTSTAKTTIAEIEIITAPDGFQAVVTFASYDETLADVEDCIDAACAAALTVDATDEEIAGALLEHQEQRFRLSYILGSWQNDTADLDNDDGEFDFDDYDDYNEDRDEGASLKSDEAVNSDESRQNQARLREFVASIRRLSRDAEHTVTNAYGTLAEQANARDRSEWTDELFPAALRQEDAYRHLVGDILDDIEARFQLVRQGTFESGDELGDWPARWRYTSTERDTFLRQIRWFSSNHHQQFGRLLTPLVNGVRVRGPFFPAHGDLTVDDSRLVLIDGEGLGHSSKEAASISTKVTGRFSEVDLILLVDNAAQPMQLAPLNLLRAVGTSGHGDKLAVAFTHFDQVKGDNLNSFREKRDHVRASIVNALSSLRDTTLASRIVETLSTRLNEQAYYLGALDRPTSRIPRRDIEELGVLIDLMHDSGQSYESFDLLPSYDFSRFELHLNDATDEFKERWEARLGIITVQDVEREHWARIKALCRRLGTLRENEYKHLRPAADLISHLQSMISVWLDNPEDWNRPHAEEEEGPILDRIRQTAFQHIHDLVEKWLVKDREGNWKVAYEYSGRGSTRVRARYMMDDIYELAAPKIRAQSDVRMQDFREAIIEVVREAIEDASRDPDLPSLPAGSGGLSPRRW